MGGFQPDGGDDTGIIRLFPAFDADAPAVTGFEAGETPLRAGRDEVIADHLLVAQELFGHQDADGVFAGVFGAGIALAIAIKASQRICAAGLQDATKNVLHHMGTE